MVLIASVVALIGRSGPTFGLKLKRVRKSKCLFPIGFVSAFVELCKGFATSSADLEWHSLFLLL